MLGVCLSLLTKKYNKCNCFINYQIVSFLNIKHIELLYFHTVWLYAQMSKSFVHVTLSWPKECMMLITQLFVDCGVQIIEYTFSNTSPSYHFFYTQLWVHEEEPHILSYWNPQTDWQGEILHRGYYTALHHIRVASVWINPSTQSVSTPCLP